MSRPTSINELVPDSRNANEGSVQGGALLEASLGAFGLGRSIVVDRHGTVIAGNHLVEAIQSIGMGDTPIVVVPTTGNTLVVVQRDDLDMSNDPNGRARGLAIADNRTGQVNLSWNVDSLLGMSHDGAVDLHPWFRDDDLTQMISDSRPPLVLTPDDDTDPVELPQEQRGGFPLAVVLSMPEYRAWLRYKERLGVRSDGEAFRDVLRMLAMQDPGAAV